MRTTRSTSTYVCASCLIRNLRTRYLNTAPGQYIVNQDAPIRSLHTQPAAGKSATATADFLATNPVSLNQWQRDRINELYSLVTTVKKRQELQASKDVASEFAEKNRNFIADTLLRASPLTSPYYNGVKGEVILQELDQISIHREEKNKEVSDKSTLTILQKLQLITPPAVKLSSQTASQTETNLGAGTQGQRRRLVGSKPPQVRKGAFLNAQGKTQSTSKRQQAVGKVKPKKNPVYTRLDASTIRATPVELQDKIEVPQLSFDLSRVLFNPGVYHLQDPRSRVYNFDPYLEMIMPVNEFNFDVLPGFITSSKDTHAAALMEKYNKRYRGSSSSLTSVLSHFHFLLSAWRPLDGSLLSKRMDDDLKTFNLVSRSPVSVYLRYQNGVYAVDADKEHDQPNVLMMQGRVMEKLLTCEKERFEKYRKPKAGQHAAPIDAEPEQYNYTTIGDFLLRAQLDAYDPRLPGSGMFDLKTRAVAGIRHQIEDWEFGMNYEIQDRFGSWDSFDREYYDMIRAAFLKYSLQVRMGRMDGIFVAYHNITRIFGFQYVSIQELDMALHGQPEQTIGDHEFKLSLKLLNAVFDEATQTYPEQSLKMVFETADPTKDHPHGIMRIFAEPVADEVIDERQERVQLRIHEFEQQLNQGSNGNGQNPTMSLEESLLQSLNKAISEQDVTGQALSQDTFEKPDQGTGEQEVDRDEETGSLSGWTLQTANYVNDVLSVRPENLRDSDRWEVQYELAAMGNEKQVEQSYASACRRRKANLGGSSEQNPNNLFLKRLRQRITGGKIWRRELDALDAGKPKTVLYDQKVSKS